MVTHSKEDGDLKLHFLQPHLVVSGAFHGRGKKRSQVACLWVFSRLCVCKA